MTGWARIVATALTAVATQFFVSWLGGALVSVVLPVQLAFMLAGVGSLFAAFLVARYVWRQMDTTGSGVLRSTIMGALLVGAISFSAGFFGPMIFTPGANQGPMLGIFITGPLGFLLGATGGAIRGLRQSSASR